MVEKREKRFPKASGSTGFPFRPRVRPEMKSLSCPADATTIGVRHTVLICTLESPDASYEHRSLCPSCKGSLSAVRSQRQRPGHRSCDEVTPKRCRRTRSDYPSLCRIPPSLPTRMCKSFDRVFSMDIGSFISACRSTSLRLRATWVSSRTTFPASSS